LTNVLWKGKGDAYAKLKEQPAAPMAVGTDLLKVFVFETDPVAKQGTVYITGSLYARNGMLTPVPLAEIIQINRHRAGVI
jgi:hypothetical protein